jgi:hypothetical protein
MLTARSVTPYATLVELPKTVRRASRLFAMRMRVSSLLASLFACLALQNLLLLRFLDCAPAWLFPLGLILLGLFAIGLRAQRLADLPTISVGRFTFCLLAATVLFALGGEGRWLYANLDWQVRDAVLNDMVTYPWPFVYDLGQGQELLRAPIGMYLLPALVGKLAGTRAADIALLVQNSLFLAVIFASMSVLFETTVRRLIALLVFLIFSGLNLIGWLLVKVLWQAPSIPDHLDPWGPVEFSSHITQAFWVPQHALAGWLCAALFLLWKDRRITVGPFLAAVPLLALWSPLAIMGAMPFAAYAGLAALLRRELRAGDVLLTLALLVIAIPALLYLKADAAAVGGRLAPITPLLYILFMLLEVAPYLVAAFTVGARPRFDGPMLLILSITLMVVPLFQIGANDDFAMRASIPPLAILSVVTADMLSRAFSTGRSVDLACGCLVILTLAIGAATGVMEIRRAFIYRPAPRTHCSFVGSWDQYFGLPIVPKATYLAPATSLPAWMQPGDSVLVDSAHDPQHCWTRAWMSPR